MPEKWVQKWPAELAHASRLTSSVLSSRQIWAAGRGRLAAGRVGCSRLEGARRSGMNMIQDKPAVSGAVRGRHWPMRTRRVRGARRPRLGHRVGTPHDWQIKKTPAFTLVTVSETFGYDCIG